MKFKQKTLKSFFTLIIIFATFLTTGWTIYYFGFKIIKKDSSISNVNHQPIFEQSEINWMTQEKALIFNRFQILLENKRPAINFTYFVDDLLMPTTIKVKYQMKKQIINWFYELRY